MSTDMVLLLMRWQLALTVVPTLCHKHCLSVALKAAGIASLMLMGHTWHGHHWSPPDQSLCCAIMQHWLVLKLKML